MSFEPDDEDIQKSIVITGLDRIGEENKALIVSHLEGWLIIQKPCSL